MLDCRAASGSGSPCVQVTTRSWFYTTPDRACYLQAVTWEARHGVTSDMSAALTVSNRPDPSRQRLEALIARGSAALLRRQAEAVFTQLPRTGEPRTQAAVGLGLLCAGSRTDMKGVISGMGRHSLRSHRHLASHGSRGTPGSLVDRSPLS